MHGSKNFCQLSGGGGGGGGGGGVMIHLTEKVL